MRYLSIDAATAALPDVAAVLEALRAQRAELLSLRDLVASGASGRPGVGVASDPDTDIDQVRLRMRGIADQMAAGALRIEDLGATLRDIESGLIDFPALVSGRPVWLCWRLGEPLEIAWWHPHDSGFAGRRPISELS